VLSSARLANERAHRERVETYQQPWLGKVSQYRPNEQSPSPPIEIPFARTTPFVILSTRLSERRARQSRTTHASTTTERNLANAALRVTIPKRKAFFPLSTHLAPTGPAEQASLHEPTPARTTTRSHFAPPPQRDKISETEKNRSSTPHLCSQEQAR